MSEHCLLAAHQPAYLPWLGYLDKIARADVFVFLDTVQFEKNSFINRNRIKTAQGAQWLTIPVKTRGHFDSTLRTTEIDDRQDWRSRHLKAISLNYRKAPRFAECYAKLERLFDDDERNLAELCWRQLRFWLDELAIDTRLVRSSELPVSSRKSDLVLDICRSQGADQYLSGALGGDYLDASAFQAAAIDVSYQAFVPPVYPQLWGPFIPGLSVLDWWMNCTASPINYKERP